MIINSMYRLCFAITFLAACNPTVSASGFDDIEIGLWNSDIQYAAGLLNPWGDVEPSKDSFFARFRLRLDRNVRQWPASDRTNNRYPYYLKNFELRGVGEYVEVWVAEDLAFPDDPVNNCRNELRTYEVTDEQVEKFITEFDTHIYPTLSRDFELPKSRDGSGRTILEMLSTWRDFGIPPRNFITNGDKIVTLVDNIRDENFYDPTSPNGRTYTAGFFSPQIKSMTQRNVMTVDSFDWLHRSGPDSPAPTPEHVACAEYLGRKKIFDGQPWLIEGIFAHEFTHLLSFEFARKDPWLEEGLADYVFDPLGYGDNTLDPADENFNAHLQTFLGFGNSESLGGPEQSLTQWFDQGSTEVLADYGSSYAFMLYLAGRFGRRLVGDLHQSRTADDVKDFIIFLSDQGVEVEFGQLIEDFLVAVALSGQLLNSTVETTVVSSVPGWRKGDIKMPLMPLSRINWDNPQSYIDPGAPGNGADYVRLRNESGNYLNAVNVTSLTFEGLDAMVAGTWYVILIAYTEGGDTVWANPLSISNDRVSLESSDLFELIGDSAEVVSALVGFLDVRGSRYIKADYNLTVNGYFQSG